MSWEGEGGVCSESASLATESGVVSGRGSKLCTTSHTSGTSECATKSHCDNIQSHSQAWKGRPGTRLDKSEKVHYNRCLGIVANATL